MSVHFNPPSAPDDTTPGAIPRRLFNLRVSPLDESRMEAIALERGMTRSQVVRVLLKEEYAKLEALGKIKPTPTQPTKTKPKRKARVTPCT